jgi:DNA-binding transcriptional regulator YdaS (Cro superfamily)
MRKRKRVLEDGLLLAIAAAGSKYRLAKLLKIGPPSVVKWRRIPAGRIIEVENATGVPREKLRPDLYR